MQHAYCRVAACKVYIENRESHCAIEAAQMKAPAAMNYRPYIRTSMQAIITGTSSATRWTAVHQPRVSDFVNSEHNTTPVELWRCRSGYRRGPGSGGGVRSAALKGGRPSGDAWLSSAPLPCTSIGSNFISNHQTIPVKDCVIIELRSDARRS